MADSERGKAMLAVVVEVYEGGKDLIPGWRLKMNAEAALVKGGIEGLSKYYTACLAGKGKGARVKETLERHGRMTLESEQERFLEAYRST